jgi:hypothetical protein
MLLGKGPGVPGLRQSIHHAAAHVENLHEPVEFFPCQVLARMDDFSGSLPFALSDYHMEELALVNSHAAGSGIGGGDALIAAKRKHLLNGQPVCGFDIGHAELEVVELCQVIRGPELVEDFGRINIMAEKL